MLSSRSHPSALGSATMVSSNKTRPREPGGLTGAHGTTCFWPLSATAANHTPWCGPRNQSRMTGLCPLLRRRYSRPSSNRWVYIRRVSGGRPCIAHTHPSHTTPEPGARHRF